MRTRLELITITMVEAMVAVSREMLVEMYMSMIAIRRFEEAANQLFAEGYVSGYLHSSIGQEATAVGACANLRRTDWITSNHRGHAHCIAKGADMKYMMAELMGRHTGYCKGKGGSMHIADWDLGILGANGIVGAGLPIANGAAFSARYRRTDQVVIAFFGDGASNVGAFHEAVNLAVQWTLPVVFFCENNGRAECVARRADGYGLPGYTVDGNDVVAVYEVSGKAVARARGGEGPTLVDAKTYRWRGRYEGDPQPYRWTPESDDRLCQDPIARLRSHLVSEHLATAEELDLVDRDVEAGVAEAVEFAHQSPEPRPAEIVVDVYA